MQATVLRELLDHADDVVLTADMPPDPFERSELVDHALVLAADLIGFAQRLRAAQGPYVTTYTVAERLAHRQPGAVLEPPRNPPPPPPTEDDPPPPPPPPTEDRSARSAGETAASPTDTPRDGGS